MAALILAAGVPEPDCAHLVDPDQVTLNFCETQRFERADAQLNAQWKQTAGALKARDGEVDRSYDQQPGYYETLLASQRAWLQFREKQCLLESFAARGGSMQIILVQGCLATLTDERIKQLKSLTEQ